MAALWWQIVFHGTTLLAGAGQSNPTSYPQPAPDHGHAGVLGSLRGDQRAQRAKRCFFGSWVALPWKASGPEGIPGGFLCSDSSGPVSQRLCHCSSISACGGPGDSDLLETLQPFQPSLSPASPSSEFPPPKTSIPIRCCRRLRRNFSFVRSGAALSGSICRRRLLESDSKC